MNETNNILENIFTRTSIRKYSDKPVEEETTRLLIKAGMAAPSACNKQPWAFILVNDKALLLKIKDAYMSYRPLATAAAGIIVCGDLSKALPGDGTDFWIEDTSAATQNILLAAHSMGLGAVWCGIYPRKVKTAFFKELFSLPQHIIPLGIISLGYPDESPEPKDKWDIGNIHINKW